MTDIVRAINPTATISNAEEARKAARASAIAIFLGVIWGVIGLVWLMGPGAAVGIAGFMIVIQLVLGLVQWFKPNIVIPILFTVLVVYGLGSTVLGMMMAEQMDLGSAAAATPAWQTWGGIALMVVQLLMHITGIRGASAMGKFRDAQAY